MSDPDPLKKIEESIAEFSSILQKFGLDLITKMGQSTLRLNMLTDKINELHKSTIDIKSLSPQLHNIIESQKSLENDMDLIKSLIQKANISAPSNGTETIPRNESVTQVKSSVGRQFTDLINSIDSMTDAQQVKMLMTTLKEDLFEKTGGHRILYEMAQYITKLEDLVTLNPLLKNEIKEKLGFWINKL